MGRSCTGYDPTKKKFVGTWISNMDSHLTVMEGDFNAETKTLTMSYQAPDPMSGAIVAHRIETVFEENSYASSFYMGEGAAAAKTMVIAMKRTGDKPVEAGAGR
jgi:hypothetical protein